MKRPREHGVKRTRFVRKPPQLKHPWVRCGLREAQKEHSAVVTVITVFCHAISVVSYMPLPGEGSL